MALTYPARRKVKEEARRERTAQVDAARAERLLDRYPSPCPRCGAGAGQPCLSGTGGRSVRHRVRDRR